jgi:hypothetical protein
MGLMNGEEGVAHQSEGPDQISVSTPRVIFAQARIFAPMEPVFDASPVIANVLEPLLERMGVVRPIADVITDVVEGLAVTGPSVVDPQRTASMGKVDFHRLNSTASDSPRLVASMPFAGYVGKRGVAAVRRARRALIVGWLPLTCSR